MPFFSAGFLAGVFLVYQLAELLPAIFAAASLLASLLLLRYPRGWLIAGILAGFGYALLQAHWSIASQLPEAMEGVDQTAVVRVLDLPRAEGRRLRFIGEVQRASGTELPRRLLLSWYQPYPKIRTGEIWQLRLRLKRPRSFASPGAFDYAGWLFRQGIGASGYVRKSSENQKLQDASWSIDLWRLRLSQRIDEMADELQEPGLIKALALGIRHDIPQQQWDVLIRTGTNHLLAISGLHIGLVAAFGWLLARWLWRLFPRLCLWLPMQRAAVIAALLPASLYAALAGFAVPTQRALIMLAVAAVAVLLWRRVRPWSVLSTALLLVLLIDPSAVLAPGFWLSFIAVAAIVALTQQQKNTGWRLLIMVQFVLLVALLPVTAAFFGRGSLISPLANLLAVPLVSLVVVPLVLAGVLTLALSHLVGETLLIAADWLLRLLMFCLQQLSALSFASWPVQLSGGAALIFAMLAVILWLMPRGVPGRWLLPLLLLPAVTGSAQPVIPPRHFQVDVLDVGQGLAVVVTTADHVLVYDTGARFSRRASAARSVVLPLLRRRGVSRIDALVISHDDNDHAGGEAELVREMAVGVRLVSTLTPERTGNAVRCRAGEQWEWDGVVFTFLHPDDTLEAADNDRSCVLRIDNGVNSVLLPGDIEAPIERHLLETSAAQLPSTLLVAPHHGSLTSSSAAFVNAVAPDWVIFSVGYRNRFNFPREAVVARYLARGSRVLRTDLSGTVTVHFGLKPGDDVSVREYARRERHWWWPRGKDDELFGISVALSFL